jgi:hypothetical protein
MTGLLLAERAPADARVLVLGAGDKTLDQFNPVHVSLQPYVRRAAASPRPDRRRRSSIPDRPRSWARSSLPPWLDRYAAYPIASGADPDRVRDARAAVAASLNTFHPEKDEAVLRAGGFRRGWIAHA